MTASVPTPKVDEKNQATAGPSLPSPWWREWGRPVVVVAVISVFVAALTLVTSLGMAAFQTLRTDIREMKADIREVKTDIREVKTDIRIDIKASEARQRQEIQEVREEIKASEARQRQEIQGVREEIKASEARQREEIQGVREEIKASEARQRQDLRETKAELKADNQVVTERLDRMFERLPAPPSDQ